MTPTLKLECTGKNLLSGFLMLGALFALSASPTPIATAAEPPTPSSSVGLSGATTVHTEAQSGVSASGAQGSSVNAIAGSIGLTVPDTIEVNPLTICNPITSSNCQGSFASSATSTVTASSSISITPGHVCVGTSATSSPEVAISDGICINGHTVTGGSNGGSNGGSGGSSGGSNGGSGGGNTGGRGGSSGGTSGGNTGGSGGNGGGTGGNGGGSNGGNSGGDSGNNGGNSGGNTGTSGGNSDGNSGGNSGGTDGRGVSGGLAGGNSGGSSGGTSGGQVLGASTSNIGVGSSSTWGRVLGNSCGIILTSYLRQHQQNPVDQVKVLQAFLNNELGLAIPVTGYFGPLTESAVNQFQLKYHGDVLLPWVPYGLPNEMTPTGYVYKTTQWKINMIACPDLNLPVPQLP